ncbi:MAG: YjjG family noncanonical pyrimidine nucleotidase [Clostridia bacterium]|nr:YjjG family noncanonical pyrimidine nucleotidase [Clostridia bacterium]
MIKKYTTVFFDLDNTLFDFLKSENKAVKNALRKNGLPHDEKTAKLYSEINKYYWEKYERNEIEKQDIFENRFLTLLQRIGKTADVKKLSDDYFGELSKGHDLMPYAKEILDYLKGKGYILCATTNGVSKTQYRRIEESGIGKYFDVVCVSEDAGSQKPEKTYFDYVFSKCEEKNRAKVLVVGDSQSSDVLGALNSMLDICWFNPEKAEPKYSVNYEIKSLKELEKIL